MEVIELRRRREENAVGRSESEEDPEDPEAEDFIFKVQSTVEIDLIFIVSRCT